MRGCIDHALIALFGAIMLAVLAAGAQAQMKPINPLAAEGGAPPSAFSAPSAAPQSPGAFGGIFGWVLRTQQSLQRELTLGVKSLKGEHAMAGAAMLAILAPGAQAEMKTINPLATEGAAPPSAFAAPRAAQQSPGAFGGIFGWVVRTQQSLQAELVRGVLGRY